MGQVRMFKKIHKSKVNIIKKTAMKRKKKMKKVANRGLKDDERSKKMASTHKEEKEE